MHDRSGCNHDIDPFNIDAYVQECRSRSSKRAPTLIVECQQLQLCQQIVFDDCHKRRWIASPIRPCVKLA